MDEQEESTVLQTNHNKIQTKQREILNQENSRRTIAEKTISDKRKDLFEEQHTYTNFRKGLR